MAAIMAIAWHYRLPVVEDAACAAGSEIATAAGWEHIGKPHGDIACFSLHGRKPITTGEGGLVTTNDANYAEAVRLLRNVGMSISAHARHAAARVEFEQYRAHGFNLRLSDIAAAIGREQLKRLPDIVFRRRRLARLYGERLASYRIAVPLLEPAWARSNWQSFPVRLAAGIDQLQVMQRMLDAGIATRRGIMCSHREAAWPRGTWICGAHRDECPGEECRALAESEQGRDRHILLPLYPGLSETDQDRIVEALVQACR
jgi:perosamine synthetase